MVSYPRGNRGGHVACHEASEMTRRVVLGNQQDEGVPPSWPRPVDPGHMLARPQRPDMSRRGSIGARGKNAIHMDRRHRSSSLPSTFQMRKRAVSSPLGRPLRLVEVWERPGDADACCCSSRAIIGPAQGRSYLFAAHGRREVQAGDFVLRPARGEIGCPRRVAHDSRAHTTGVLSFLLDFSLDGLSGMRRLLPRQAPSVEMPGSSCNDFV